MTTRISPTLIQDVSGGRPSICCAQCNHPLTPSEASSHWKDHALLKTTPVNELPGWSSSVHPELVLRQFVCNECGHLLDSEISLRDDPFLYDVVELNT